MLPPGFDILHMQVLSVQAVCAGRGAGALHPGGDARRVPAAPGVADHVDHLPHPGVRLLPGAHAWNRATSVQASCSCRHTLPECLSVGNELGVIYGVPGNSMPLCVGVGLSQEQSRPIRVRTA